MKQAALIDNDVKQFNLTLPWPPTVNSYYIPRTSGKRVWMQVSERGIQYQRSVWAICQSYNFCTLGNNELLGRKLKITVFAYPPDERQRDLDNLNKCLLDSMQKAGVYKNDYDIDDIRVIRKEQYAGGQVKVVIQTM